MELSHVRQTSIYEWLVGLAGIGFSLWLLPALEHSHLWITLVLLVLAAFLESIPVPLGKATGTLMTAIPFAAAAVYGPASAVWITFGGELLAPVFARRHVKVSTWLFNAGQYTLSTWVMCEVYGLFNGDGSPAVVDWQLVIGVIVGIAAFFVVNHTFVNVLYLFRRTFSVHDMVQLVLQDGLNVLVGLPLAFLLILLSPHRPFVGPIMILPIALLAQMLRLYRKSFAMQLVHKVTAQLTSEFDFDRICESAAETACKLTYADAVTIFVHDEKRHSLVPNTVFPLAHAKNFDVDGYSVTDGGIMWTVASDKTWVYVPDTLRDSRVRFGRHGILYRSMVIFPMQARGALKIVLVCYSERPHAFGGEMIEYVNSLAAQVSVLLDNAQLYQTLQEQSVRDGATGLYNYRYFYEELERRVERARQTHAVLSVAVIDIDYFKKFNDTYGHLAGDAVLAGVGQVLENMAGRDALVARYGGEEFGIIFPYGPQETIERIEVMRTEVARYSVEYEGYHLQNITFSSGVASFPQHGLTDRDVLLKADSAMYWGAKQRGRNRIALYTPEFESQLFVDGLTGLYTHHFINIRTREEFNRGVKNWGALCLDLENFSFVNASFGFDVGDRVLHETSLLIKECLRHDELACRFGGDEFLVLLSDVTEEDLHLISSRITKTITGHRFECSPSVVLSMRAQIVANRFTDVEDPADLFDRISAVFAGMHQVSGDALA